eukprot:GHRR01030196.1.p1 GENE.GHRR01030196.1~~GHRR01030196.1.p1  ORF type:complete len:105 (-),score=18.09 GHRR01030196.1:232-546(-)
MLPFTVPAKLSARWQAMFASQSYENFLMSEGERIWAFRNRMENERWFWEVFAVDRWVVRATIQTLHTMSTTYSSATNRWYPRWVEVELCICSPESIDVQQQLCS